MAIRPIFIPCENGDSLVTTKPIEFSWSPGMAVSQKQKSIQALHSSAKELGVVGEVLEISSKSEDELGRSLSAFNLKYKSKKNLSVSVECLYQSSKVFEKGGPFRDLLYASSLDAKRDPRLKESGKILHFLSPRNDEWPLEPKTLFYDWVYLNVLAENTLLQELILKYSAFTDIEFNPKKSINCQAYSVALFAALYKRRLLNSALSSPQNYKEIVTQFVVVNANENQYLNPNLF